MGDAEKSGTMPKLEGRDAAQLRACLRSAVSGRANHSVDFH